MLTLIYDRLTRQVFDDVMEVAWSTMWNVTDETAINCERFLDGRGMEYFLECLQVCQPMLEIYFYFHNTPSNLLYITFNSFFVCLFLISSVFQ